MGAQGDETRAAFVLFTGVQMCSCVAGKQETSKLR